MTIIVTTINTIIAIITIKNNSNNNNKHNNDSNNNNKSKKQQSTPSDSENSTVQQFKKSWKSTRWPFLVNVDILFDSYAVSLGYMSPQMYLSVLIHRPC